MKKAFFLTAILALVILSSCQKDSPEATTNNLVTPPANLAPTIGVSFAADQPGDIANEPFNGNFTIAVPDMNNVFEKQPVRLVSKSMDVVSYVWKINDLKVYDRNPTLSFTWHGIYHITLIVKDNNGNTATSTKDLSILCNFMH